VAEVVVGDAAVVRLSTEWLVESVWATTERAEFNRSLCFLGCRPGVH
jgi:hypothetical protein